MLRRGISERSEELPVSTIGKLLKIAVESKDVISLGPGEPDFETPKHILRSAKTWLGKGYTHYSPPGGRKELKEEIVRKLKKDNGISAGPEQIMVTTGSTEGILLALMCTIDPGEGVIITDPGFLAYKPTVEVLNGTPISVPLYEKDGWQIDVDRMKEMIIPEKTNAMIINTPTNPTGTVYTKRVLEEIADFAREYDILVISDEAYEKLVYGDSKHVSIGSLNGMEDYVMTLHSCSKTYAMAGFRLGWAVGPEKIIRLMTKLHIFTSLTAPTVSQLAATDALRGPQKCVEDMRKEYDRRRKLIVKRLNGMGLVCKEPKGAFYAFPSIKDFGMKSLGFSEWLLKEGKVAVVPGTEFGGHGEGYVRCSYATEYGLIEKAMDRMEKALKKNALNKTKS